MTIQCRQCGNNREFITQLNQYSVYKVVRKQLEYQKNETIDGKIKLYCRDCAEELTEVSAHNTPLGVTT